ncbi:MAG: hypothetical protein MUO62_17120 [Anaerolineales bacterium]|nr:hypothetical protein [Anaerolineales bacterium]
MMDKRKLFIILSLALISVVIIAAAPMAQSDVVSLTIENRSDDYVTFKLQGPTFYFLTVKPHTSSAFTILRGDYTQKFYSCGLFLETSFDLTKKQAIVVPACGEKAFKTNKAFNNKIDAGQLIKLVKITFENTSDVNMALILKGSSEHVFFIRSGDEVSYTIPRGPYEVTQLGCQYSKYFTFHSYANRTKELTCPSQ